MELDHVTIRTADLQTTRDFFIEVFNLEEKPRPKIIQNIPGHWLYSENRPLVHIIGSFGKGYGLAPESIDHVGFKLEGYRDFRKKLESLNIPHSLMDIAELQERRIFFRAPGGPLLETVFHEPI